MLFERLPVQFLPEYQKAVRKLARETSPFNVILEAPLPDCPGRGVGYQLRIGCSNHLRLDKLKIGFRPFLQDLDGYQTWYEEEDPEESVRRLDIFLSMMKPQPYQVEKMIREKYGWWHRDLIIKKCTHSPCTCFELSELQAALPRSYQKRFLIATGLQLIEFVDVDNSNETRTLNQKQYHFTLKPLWEKEKEGFGPLT